MTLSLPTQFMLTMKSALQSGLVAGGFRQAASQSVPTGVYVDRYDPVGDNEKNYGPVIKLFMEEVKSSDQECHTMLLLSPVFTVDIHILYNQSQVFREVVDPVVQKVHQTVMTAGPSVPGVQLMNLRAIGYEGATGEAGLCRVLYNLRQSVSQLDLTATP